MSNNPVSRIRLSGSIAIVAVIVLCLAAATLSIGPSGDVWVYIIGGVSITYAVASFVIHMRNPGAVDAAWDEQNIRAHKDSLVFGYWAVLWVFVLMVLFTVAGPLDPAKAFYWLGPVLAAVPPAHFVVSVMRGRAE